MSKVEANKLQCLLKSWIHSREEDAHGLTVYRPAGFKFPLSRGRDGLEFRPDGTFVQTGPGPDDRGRAMTGSWKSPGKDAIDLHPGGTVAPRRMTIVDCDDHALLVRWEE